MTTYTPVPPETAASMIGEGVHTGLRKGSDADDAPDLWRAIFNSDTTAWRDALDYAVYGLAFGGYVLCRVEESESPTTITTKGDLS